jgi:hypothetical protein
MMERVLAPLHGIVPPLCTGIESRYVRPVVAFHSRSQGMVTVPPATTEMGKMAHVFEWSTLFRQSVIFTPLGGAPPLP